MKSHENVSNMINVKRDASSTTLYTRKEKSTGRVIVPSVSAKLDSRAVCTMNADSVKMSVIRRDKDSFKFQEVAAIALLSLSMLLQPL